MIHKNSLPLIAAVIAIAASAAPATDIHVGSGETHTTIQSAINAATNGDTVIVDPGTYDEYIDLAGKNITVSSTNPHDWSVVSQTIIKSPGFWPTIQFFGTEDAECMFSGFTITNGFASIEIGGCGGGIWGGGN